MEFFEFLGIAIVVLALVYTGFLIGKHFARNQFEEEIKDHREDAVKKSRAVLSGQFSEQIAPYMPDFPYKPTEARFIGKPVDFIVFKGMDEKKIDEVVFVEVKTGQGKLNDVEKSLKETVQGKKIEWHEYRISQKEK